jgi:hypothetical protein
VTTSDPELELVLAARGAELPGGLHVRRALPQARRRTVGPFVFVDQMGPASGEREVTVLPHPHIGLSTITYLFEGEGLHRDSLGTVQRILPGEVNWMTAGRGITHSERFEAARRSGGPIHGLQAWVALPKEDEETDPVFAHHGPEDLPTYEGHGLWARLVAGEAFGAKAAVKTNSPLFYVHWQLKAGAKAENFVSSSKERLEQAKADWRAGRMKLPDLDNGEFIPLPRDPAPANPMS